MYLLLQAKPSGFRFWIKSIRSNTTTYPYLLLPSRNTWLYCPNGGSTDPFNQCLSNNTYVRE